MNEGLETGETTDVAHITLITVPSIKSSLPFEGRCWCWVKTDHHSLITLIQ